MTTRDLTEADIESTVADNAIVLVDFWAAWCGPCRQFAPVYAAASERHPDIVFAKIDTEAEPRLAGGFGITSIPTLMAFREGVLVFAQPGALPAAALGEVIDGVRGLDMTVVHAQVARQRELAAQPREVGQQDFATAHLAGAAIIDVREPGEFRAGHVPRARLVPLGQLAARLDEVPDGGPVYVICASGQRSLQATDVLRANGIEAYSVAGGTNAWRDAGRDIVTGD